MSDDDILALMMEIDSLKRENTTLKTELALIADFSVSGFAGYVDEWTEASAFSECQRMAEDCLRKLGIDYHRFFYPEMYKE